MPTDPSSITCPRCCKVSHNAGDIEHRYCAACKLYHLDFAIMEPDSTAGKIAKLEEALLRSKPEPRKREVMTQRLVRLWRKRAAELVSKMSQEEKRRAGIF